MTQRNYIKVSAMQIAVGILMAASASTASAQDAAGSNNVTFARPQEASDSKPSIGLQLGYADTEGRSNSSLGYGIEASYQPYIPFGLGVELGGYTASGQGGDTSLTRTELLARGLYNLAGNIPVIRYSYVGAKAGVVADNVSHNLDVNFGYGPTLGFDIPLENRAYSVGANATYLFVAGAKDDVFALNAMVKRWF